MKSVCNLWSGPVEGQTVFMSFLPSEKVHSFPVPYQRCWLDDATDIYFGAWLAVPLSKVTASQDFNWEDLWKTH